MDITDEKLNEYILTEKTARVMIPLEGVPEHSRGEEKEKLIADWIVNYFCRLCPHRMK